VDNTDEFRCISLCTGYAGIELGLERVIPNLRTVCYVEREGFACANLVAKIEQGKLAKAPIWTDIKTFNGKPFRDRVHIITGGYPCQPFSVAGQRKGTDDPRHLWPYIEGIIEAVEPVWCFFENVSGHLTIGFPSVYRSLRNLGYSVEAGLFTAAEVGAPHKRERLFILANSGHVCRQRKYKSSESNQNYRWPSRPGQPQYEWEEPRVISYTSDGGRGKLLQQEQKCRGNIKTDVRSKSEISMEGQTKPRLGRTVNGTNSRVDRLRLLGNGVVPQCAELAFRTLIEKF
jgi:DNA (cytosine-5)-methyltransferase 1